jgi:protein-S-isoprenylcysteine O-methyltransferase Ste14
MSLMGIALAGFAAWPWGIATMVLVGLGAVIIVLAALALEESFSVHPIPNEFGLRTKGIYAIVRHPMYLALILIAAGICLASPPRMWLVFAFLVIVLLVKIVIEELGMAETYPGYLDYRKRVKALIPFIW